MKEASFGRASGSVSRVSTGSPPEGGEASPLHPGMWRTGAHPFRRALLAVPLVLGLLSLGGCGDAVSDASDQEDVLVRQSAVASGDFNADGRLDMAVSSAYFTSDSSFRGDVAVYLQDPNTRGAFLAPQRYEVGFDPAHVASADVNRDGLPDLVTANESSNTVSVLRNQQGNAGIFGAAEEYRCGTQPLAVAVADLNGDTLPDIVVAVKEGVDVLLQSPSGTFSFSSRLSVPGGAFSVAIGFLDGDTFPDIACTGTANVVVFFGGFAASLVLPAGVQPHGIVVADVDLDTYDDIVVANIGTTETGANSSVWVLLQDPVVPGTFPDLVTAAAPAGTRNLAVADLNADLYPDIAAASTVVAAQNPGSISVFLTQGGALSFSSPVSYPDGFTPEYVALGDFNGDLRRDIAVQDGPSILFQSQPPGGAGTFLPEVVVDATAQASLRSAARSADGAARPHMRSPSRRSLR